MWHPYWDKSSVGHRDAVISSLTAHIVLLNTSFSFLSWQGQRALQPLLSPPAHCEQAEAEAWFRRCCGHEWIFAYSTKPTLKPHWWMNCWLLEKKHKHTTTAFNIWEQNVPIIKFSSSTNQTAEWFMMWFFSVNLRNVGNQGKEM